jgi:hypothetical protein
MFLRNVGIYPQVQMVLQPITTTSSSSPPWEPPISLLGADYSVLLMLWKGVLFWNVQMLITVHCLLRRKSVFSTFVLVGVHHTFTLGVFLYVLGIRWVDQNPKFASYVCLQSLTCRMLLCQKTRFSSSECTWQQLNYRLHVCRAAKRSSYRNTLNICKSQFVLLSILSQWIKILSWNIVIILLAICTCKLISSNLSPRVKIMLLSHLIMP